MKQELYKQLGPNTRTTISNSHYRLTKDHPDNKSDIYYLHKEIGYIK